MYYKIVQIQVDVSSYLYMTDILACLLTMSRKNNVYQVLKQPEKSVCC